ncbi:MAG: DUF3883 domain-containing protein [Prevotellaceae bacterium]|nr:DUF3883 domain-containing protein [Prevotellaceae bacterium]
MFFTINSERKIGYKKLSRADLGLSPTSHQTHIGLYENMLDFLDNADTTTAMLIYGNYCDILNCDFDRIENPDGSYRSPKIRKGTTGGNTIVKQIRTFATANPQRNYFLIWFGLDNNELLFWLIDDTSNDYLQISSYLPRTNKVYDASQIDFSILLFYIEDKINKVSIKIQQELEITAQTGVNISKRRYKPIDIEKAQNRYKETGRKGEELINEYLGHQQRQSLIHSFTWENKNRESGKPFDFIINPGRGDEQYIDVKSTLYKFEQPLIFSNGEIHFIQSVANEKYSVFRVYDMNNIKSKLRICKSCLQYMRMLDGTIISFQKEMAIAAANVQEMKIAIKPNNTTFGNILDAIVL